MSESLHDSQSNVAKNARLKQREQHRAIRAITLHQGIVWMLVLALCLVSTGAVSGEQSESAPMQSLDEQVQEIKSDVLTIAAELNRLEEKLLYPSDTQMAVFVSLAQYEKSRLDSVEITLDGEPVAHHIYSFKELEALQKGGVQRIYTGNVRTGEHRLDVTVSGKLPSGSEWSGTETFTIVKEVKPKLVGIQLGANEFGNAKIRLGEQSVPASIASEDE